MKRRGLTKTMRFAVLERDDFTCRYCGRHPPGLVLHCDHVVPVCHGGANHMRNLFTACSDCNLGKGARLIEDRSRTARQLEMRLEGGRRPARAAPDFRRLFYIEGILRNRMGDKQLRCVPLLHARLARGVSIHALEHAAKRARDWSEFERLVGVTIRSVTICSTATGSGGESEEARPCGPDAAGSSRR
jgi:hypothetical protein